MPVGPDEAVVLAVPPWVAAGPAAGAGRAGRSSRPSSTCISASTADPGRPGSSACSAARRNGFSSRPGIVSVTISAANRIADLPAEELAARVWPDVRAALRPRRAMPPVRVVKERRATFAATAAQERRRPGPRWPAKRAAQNLVLAGDWTGTGLPATIEGAIRSGYAAAAAILCRRLTGNEVRCLANKHSARAPPPPGGGCG